MSLFRPAIGAIRFVLALILAISVLAPVSGVHAQGTSGMLPDPISTRELDDYGRVMQLSQQQRQAIDPMHDQYLAQFDQLRESEIGDFLQNAQSLRRNMFSPTGVEDVKKATRDHKRIMARIASIDEQLLNQMQTVLSEQQLPSLSRVRLARERQRYTSDATRFATSSNPGVRVDLSEIIASLSLSAEEHQLTDPQVVTYEQQLTNALRQMHNTASGMYEKISESIAAAGGMPAEGEQDPQRMRQMFETFRDAFETAQADVLVEATKVSTLNRNTFKAIAPQLSPDNRRDFQRRFERRGYASAFRGTGAGDRRLTAVKSLDDIPTETQQAIDQLRLNFETRRNPISDQLMNLSEQQRAERGGQFRFGGNDDSPMREQLDTQRDRLRSLETETIAQLDTILGAGLVAALDGKGDEGQDGESGPQTATFVVAGTSGGTGGGGGVATLSGTVELESVGEAATDPYVPGPISRSDLEYYLTKLNADEDRRTIVDSIYSQYIDEYQQMREQYVEPLAEANRNTFSFRRNRDRDDAPPPTAADISRTFELRRDAMNTVLALDQAFFENMGLIVASGEADTAQLKRCEQSRLRDVYNRGEGGGTMFMAAGGGRFRGDFGGGQEQRVDLTRATRDVPLNDQAAQIEPILNDYSNTITGAFRSQYELSMQFAEATAKVMVDAFPAGDDDNNRQQRFRAMGERMRELNETQGTQREDVEKNIIALNRQTVDRMRESLPESLSRAVRDAYYKAAYPSVYADRRSARRHIDAAIELPSLTSQQRADLMDVAAEFHGAYDELCLKMVEAQMTSLENASSQQRGGRGQGGGAGRGGGPGGGPGGQDWQRMQEQRNEIERLRFSRNELNEKTRLRLRSTLNEQQINQVAGLGDEPTDD